MKSDLLALSAIALWSVLAVLGVELSHIPPFLLTGLALVALVLLVNAVLAFRRVRAIGYVLREDDLLFRYNKRNRIQASVSQTVAGVSLYLNGYQQDYWGTSKKERSLSLGFNTVVAGTSYHIAYTYSKTNGDESDRMVSLGFSIPLARWLPRAWSSYNISNTKNGYTRHNIGVDRKSVV